MVKIIPKTVNKVSIPNPTVQKLQQLKDSVQIAALRGDFKTFKKAQREFAALAINNFEETKQLKSLVKGTFSIISPAGFRLFKIWMRNKFSKKTPQEKIFNSILKLEKMDAKTKQDAIKYFRRTL